MMTSCCTQALNATQTLVERPISVPLLVKNSQEEMGMGRGRILLGGGESVCHCGVNSRCVAVVTGQQL